MWEDAAAEAIRRPPGPSAIRVAEVVKQDMDEGGAITYRTKLSSIQYERDTPQARSPADRSRAPVPASLHSCTRSLAW
jgi:hypothetical protein